MNLLTRLLLSFAFVCVSIAVPTYSHADTIAPYSKPFHKQGRGWYPSIYWSTGRNLGSFYFPNTNGRPFKPLDDTQWDSEANALIYFYRPSTQWAEEELEAPSYYINDQLVFNLRAGSYTVIELPAGSYDFAARKSILPLIGFEAFDDKLAIAFDLNLLGDIGLNIDAGSITYFRHSEESLPERLHPDLDPEDPMATADLQLVDEELALKEMADTRYLEHSFWHSNDSEDIQDLLSGELQDYGWFSVIWPWSNNFLFGFPIFYLPSDIYYQLTKDEKRLTLEEKLYLLKDNPDAYLDAIKEIRGEKRDWLAPWRAPTASLSLNDELLLERLERAALAGNIQPPPKPKEEENKGPLVVEEEDPNRPWYWPFRTVNQPEGRGYEMSPYMNDKREEAMEKLKLSLK